MVSGKTNIWRKMVLRFFTSLVHEAESQLLKGLKVIVANLHVLVAVEGDSGNTICWLEPEVVLKHLDASCILYI